MADLLDKQIMAILEENSRKTLTRMRLPDGAADVAPEGR
jgi:hypothetical protein